MKFRANWKRLTVKQVSRTNKTGPYAKTFDSEFKAWQWIYSKENKNVIKLRTTLDMAEKKLSQIKQKIKIFTTQKNIKNSDALLAIIKEIIAHKLAREIESIDVNKHIVNDLGADSLDLVEIIMAFEDKFDIEIPDEDAETLRYIKDFLVYLSERHVVI